MRHHNRNGKRTLHYPSAENISVKDKISFIFIVALIRFFLLTIVRNSQREGKESSA